MTQLSSNTTGSVMLHSQVKAMRKSVKGAVVSSNVKASPQRLEMAERLNHLKMFSRGKSPEQLSDVVELKEQGLREAIKALYPELGQRAFQRHDIYEFLLELDSGIELGEWRLRENAQEVIVYASYGSVFPGLRFQKRGDVFHCTGFNFDIRLAS
ncbi:hypothetical protein MW344_003751 [Vibrio parahaemolyticus]|uniref:Uncharacterized protein n=1 Tax=Vibrio parahaemolyticus TaxID=670 RepID=A0A9Q3UF63_VIBPH|nr:hypothetical protein [Vibrio parahaemolyticus]EGQ8101919.1 hypothetical protein [Vibrio parahaemolyticus]EGQ8548774.1 hypothetical protein [Vibrio parahaemolyticus]EGQ9073805.1 hypothetical protein [Vibrio parahaemolyticus]EGQ9129694.1 hypothetical protein [Vibrio parahaemolyticus]EGQ9286451.1 hypothetical protein [Vibrio parahaemolyticus]